LAFGFWLLVRCSIETQKAINHRRHRGSRRVVISVQQSAVSSQHSVSSQPNTTVAVIGFSKKHLLAKKGLHSV
jgi:hypothetical protein